MENKGTIAIPIIGYIISIISPIIGLVYGAALVFFKKKHSTVSKAWEIHHILCYNSICHKYNH